MKEKHKQIETKKHFHLMSIVIMAFLGRLTETKRQRFGQSGKDQLYALERQVNDLFMNWDSLLKGNQSFGEVERIDVKEMVTMWKYMGVNSDDFGSKKGNRRTRIGLITTAMRLLETEGLVVILDRDDIPKAIPSQSFLSELSICITIMTVMKCLKN